MGVQEIEAAITQLPHPELSQLAAWFEEYQADLWDWQIEKDALSGRFDALAEQANQEFEVDRCQPVAEIIRAASSSESWELTPRPYGLAKGEFVVPDDFDAPLPEDILRDFEGRE